MKQLFRLFVILFSTGILTVSCQQAPSLSMKGPKSFNFSKDGGSQSFTFSTNRDWSVRSSESWCKVSPSSGAADEGSIMVTVIVEKNTSYDPRTCTLTVMAEDLTEMVSIAQDSGIGLIISPKSFNLTNAAQNIEIEVQKNVKYSIAIDENCADWIKVGNTKALSTQKVTFIIAANETYDDREGKVTFKQDDGDLAQTVIIRQSQTNGLFITTPEYDLSNEAHTLTVEVKANVEFEVTSQADWIKYESTSTKSLSPSQIKLQVDANETYDNREGKVIVKQKGGAAEGIITIRQDEQYGLFISQENISISKDAQTVEVQVKYNVDFDVIVPYEAMTSMISTVEYEDVAETKALSTRVYRINVLENTLFENQVASITFKQKDGPLSGTVTITQETEKGVFINQLQNHYDINPSGDTFRVNVYKNVSVNVEIDCSWITQVETKTISEEILTFSVAKNTFEEDREGRIILSAEGVSSKIEITITQYGGGYFKGDVLIENDSDLAAFNSRSVRVIDGNLTIKNMGELSAIAINNLLQKVTGTIRIEGDTAQISGFENLSYVHSIRLDNCNAFSVFKNLSELPGSFSYVAQETHITDFSGMEWLTRLGGGLTISTPDMKKGLDSIESFKGFDNLEIIEGDLFICGSFGNLQSFTGFNRLKTIGSGFRIHSYSKECFPKITNFKGFDSLEEIDGAFGISFYMPSLISFHGLESLKRISGDFSISRRAGTNGTPNLHSFEGLENLEEIGGTFYPPLSVYNVSNLKSLRVLGGIVSTENPNIDYSSFVGFPLRRIGRFGVEIYTDVMEDLSFMRNIEVIEGDFRISGANINNYTGISSLREVGGTLRLGNSCEGFSALTTVGSLSIGNVSSLKGLEGLEVIRESLTLFDSYVESLDDLESLRSLGEDFHYHQWPKVLIIYRNSALIKYSALQRALRSYVEKKCIRKDDVNAVVYIEDNKYNPTGTQILNGEGDLK